MANVLSRSGVGLQFIGSDVAVAVASVGSSPTPGRLGQRIVVSERFGIMATTARVNPKTGIPEHKHDNLGFHWASAGHRDDGKVHKDAGADKPTFVEGTTDEQKELYGKAFRREEGFVAKIPSKAKPKDGASASSETQTVSDKDVKEMPKEVAESGSRASTQRQPTASAAR